MSIFEKMGFSDLELGEEILSVEEMTLIPIKKKPGTGRDITEVVADPEAVNFRGNQSYGEMSFRNDDSRPAIINSNTMVISDKAAQDHAMSGPGIVLSNSSKRFTNCCCIQQSQGGHLEGDDERNHYDILPIFLRKKLLSKSLRKQNEFGKLWNDITEFTKCVHGRGRGHLEDFFRDQRVSEQLSEFVAEFEPTQHQIGAVILFNQRIVGIEIQPTVKHWLHYWEWFIRGCYGADLVRNRLLPKYVARPLDVPLPDDLNKCLSSVKQSVLRFRSDVSDTIVNGIIPNLKGDQPKQVNRTNLSSQLLTSQNGGGDLIVDSAASQAIYLSLIL